MKYHLSKDTLPFSDGRMLYDLLLLLTKARGYVAPRETTVFELEAAPGIIHATDALHTTSIGFAVTPIPAAETQIIKLQLADGKFTSTNMVLPNRVLFNSMFNVQFDQFGEISAGKIRLEIENTTDQRGAFWLLNFNAENPPPTPGLAPFLSGKRLLSTQSFRELFRSEVVSNEEGLGVKDITVLFTDLKGSTAIYEKIGDPQAFFLVRQHFDALGRVIAQHSGAIVKTIGDAVMATFMNPLDAVQAALEMLRAIDDFNQGIAEKMILKIGIHRGHSIAVTLNDRLDYFGQTVNIASRVQGLAEAGEIYMTDDVYSFPGIQETLAAYKTQPESAAIRGIREKMSVYKVTNK
jgi:class 3 adenylate cyclase